MNPSLSTRAVPISTTCGNKGTSPGLLAWIDRLAAWADRQPRHHHLGRWTAI